ncbi:MAG: HAD-IA family hydrolase [Propionibacteriaceae bacterium]|nr:HAD-IA family hydrolase [Propionibacteriaceae bacterium]
MTPAPWPIVVFDLDGTVADTIDLIMASYEHAVNSVVGEALDRARARRWIGRTLAASLGEAYPDQAQELLASYFEFNAAKAPEFIKRFPGMNELLDELEGRGVRTAIATSKRAASTRQTLELIGADVRVTITMEDTLLHKPDPEPLLLAVSRLGGEPAQAAYVGDAVVDVQAAQAAGMAAIAVTWGAGDRADLAAAAPTALVDTPAQLRAVLLGAA